jgi:trehalose 6-phosphate phosphatase
MIPAALAEAVAALVRRPQILVGLDFDGVLAPIVEEREAARALPGTMDAVCELARCDGVHVALVSGRALESLGHVSGLSAEDPLTLVGSHGAEVRLHGEPPGPDAQARPTSAQRDLLDRVINALEEIAGPDGSPAALEVEVKPSAAVLHTRRAPDEVARRAEAAALAGPGSWTGVHAIRGKAVVELSVLDTSKGLALQRLRSLLDVESILYAGDDVTDETAFAALGPDDVAVKVGPGATRAAYRLDGPEDVRELLRLLLQLVVAERSQR